MKILFLPNWKVEYCAKKPEDKQPPDYYIPNKPYWFFRYFDHQPEVDVLDIRSTNKIESFEQNKLRFYVWQAIRAIPKLKKYDLIISHGMQSGVVISLWRRLFKSDVKHIVFDIGAFNSAAESGFALKLMQFASKSIDGIIYHTSSQKDYYKKFFPWIVDKSQFIRFGTDSEYFKNDNVNDDQSEYQKPYCVCVGYNKRDWDTVVNAFVKAAPKNLTLKMIGHVEPKYLNIAGIEQIDRISIKALMKQISGSKFGILPLKSYNYSYGQMTLMQQMAMEKCVIAARVPSLVDYVRDGDNAVLYESENVEQLSDKINMVNENHELRSEIGLKARKFIENDCNEITMARQIEMFVDKVVTNMEG